MQPSAPTACLDENLILSFIGGRLSESARRSIEAHLTTCATCMALVALAARNTADGSPSPLGASPRVRGASIGRYTILDLIGRGGMAEVYTAYDPELDRRVAVKLLHEEGLGTSLQADARARLLREAKAIARLSHPNVVVVYDAGSVDGRVFIAMEFIRGQTLSEWLAAGPRSWPAVRDMFLAAGRGLAAAHAAGLVHRDVKPQNVLVGDDGSVRVTDFGLASDVLGDNGGGRARADFIDAAVESAPPAATLTRTGAWLGTPLYMAPEQFNAQKADARTDQFSFCVALHEAAYGERPFAGNSLIGLRDAVVGGRLREAPRKHGAPAWLRKTLVRGLSVRPDDRFPSMDALLAALSRDPARRRRRIALGVAFATALLTTGAVVHRSVSHPVGVLCTASQEKVAPIWERPGDKGPHPRRTAAERAFLATGKNYAPVAWQKAAALVDAYVGRWTAMAKENCEATHISGEQSPQVLDLRTACLNSALGGLQATTDLLIGADGDVVASAISVASGLPDLARCADISLLRAIVTPPVDSAQRARAEALDRRAAELRALLDADKPNVALPKARALVDEAVALGYEPVTAMALSILGRSQSLLGDHAAAVQSFQRAMPAVIASRDDPRAAEIAGILAGDFTALGRFDDGDTWAGMGESFATRAGPSAGRARGWLAQARGINAVAREQFGEAVRNYREAIALKQKAAPHNSIDVAISYDSLALAQNGLGDRRAALETNRQAAAILEQAGASNTVLMACLMNNRGEFFIDQGLLGDALDAFSQSLQIFGGVLTHDAAWVAFPLTGMGRALLGLQRSHEAIEPLERSLAIREKEDPTPVHLGETRFALARALWGGGGDKAHAISLAARAREDYIKEDAPSSKTAAAEIDAWLATRAARRSSTPHKN